MSVDSQEIQNTANDYENEESLLNDTDKRAETEFVKCSTCGGNMVFDPEKQVLSCPYCGQYKDFLKDSDVKERDIETAFELAEKWDDTSVVSCDNCGAKFVVTSNEVALYCPYCGTSHVRKSSDLAGIKPNALYPFIFSRERANDIAKKWAKRKLFAPKRFKKNICADNIHGVYEPCFTFDSKTVSCYDGRLGKRRTRTIRTKDGVRTETYIEWRHVSGVYDHFFDDVTIAAGGGLEQRSYDKLSPFDMNTIKVYNKDYLAGYSANHYSKDLKTAWEESKQIMDSRIRKFIVDMYNCDVVGYLNVSTIHNDATFKYVLLPVYILNYRYGKKDYKVLVNGNTGKVTGKTPVSFWRVLIAILLGFGVIAGCCLLANCEDNYALEAINSLLML